MMRSVTLLACFALSFLNAQNDFSFVSQDEWANYAAMDVKGNAIALAGFHRQCDTPFFSYLDKNTGEELWSSEEAAMYYGTYTDVKFANDGSIWAVGWRRQADDVPYDQAAIITHFSANGDVLFHQEVLDDAAHEENIMSVQPLANGQVVWSTGLTVQRLNNDGTTELVRSFELPVTHLVAFAADVFVVSIYNSVFFKNAFGDLQEIYTSSSYITDLKGTDEGIYWTHDDRLFFYNFTSAEIIEWPLPQNFTYATQLHITQGEVLIYSTLYSPHLLARLLPDQSAVVITNTWETPDRTLFQVIEENGTFYQLGNDLFESQLSYAHLSHGFVRKSTGLPAITGPDIGITGINIMIDSFNLYISDISYQVNASWSGEVQVTNYGDMPVDHFIIGGPIQGNFNCAEGRYFSKENITIAANSSITVPITYRSYHWVNLDEEGDFTFSLELCLYTAAPNSELDENTTNDHYCETFVVVDTEEQLFASNELQVFPNPTNDQVTLSLPGTQLQALSVYDQTGRLMLQQKLGFGEQEKVSLAQLPSGIYWLKVVTDDGVISQKIIKQ